jgi:pimeloyl-ACP methyl ester carboxylesterase
MAETFVLVHGAWHGAWCWAAVTAQLAKLGDRAFAVDLPGHGEDRTDRATMKLDDYVANVVRFIEERDLRDVILAGHSLGGLTVSGVTGRIARRIKRAVFVSAFVWLDGESVLDKANEANRTLLDFVNTRPDRSLAVEMMGPDFLTGLMNDVPGDMRRWVEAALCPEPIGPLFDPVPMKAFHSSGVPTAYVVCENDQTPVAGAPNWHPHFSSRLQDPALKFVKCGHEIMFTQPAECARVLHEMAVAQPPRRGGGVEP